MRDVNNNGVEEKSMKVELTEIDGQSVAGEGVTLDMLLADMRAQSWPARAVATDGQAYIVETDGTSRRAGE